MKRKTFIILILLLLLTLCACGNRTTTVNANTEDIDIIEVQPKTEQETMQQVSGDSPMKKILKKIDEKSDISDINKLLGAPDEIKWDSEGLERHIYYNVYFYTLPGTLSFKFRENELVYSLDWRFEPLGNDSTENYTQESREIYNYFFNLYGAPEQEYHAYSLYRWDIPSAKHEYVIDDDIIRVSIYFRKEDVSESVPMDELSAIPGNHVITWDDDGLELAMRDITGITDRDIWLSDVNELTSINATNYNVKNIEALSELTNLTWLSLSMNQITDISPLGELRNLTYLELADNQIKDISVLENLTQLEKLYLFSNNISNIDVLGQLSSLTVLNIWDNPIEDYSPVEDLNLTVYQK